MPDSFVLLRDVCVDAEGVVFNCKLWVKVDVFRILLTQGYKLSLECQFLKLGFTFHSSLLATDTNCNIQYSDLVFSILPCNHYSPVMFVLPPFHYALHDGTRFCSANRFYHLNLFIVLHFSR